MKKKILVFCDFYLPGFKSGGGMWTVVNLVDRFADRYNFFIVTRNYESKGDRAPYTSVRSGEWNRVGNAEVFYLAKEHHALKTFVSVVSEVRPDAVFLNSALSMPVVRFLTVRRKRLIDPVPVVLAPCGEFSAGALSIKPLKKRLFLTYARTVGLYKDVIWKASFESEQNEIRNVIGQETEIWIAADLAPKSILPDFDPAAKPLKKSGSAKFVFLSRITRKKNIDFFLERLAEISSGEIAVDLLGPIEDTEYWDECLALIKKCPPNISVNAEAEFIPYETGLQRMLDSHFFVLPTLGENFGYVFVEAMAAGTPLMISENTVWKDVEQRKAGWEIPLANKQDWLGAIQYCVEMGPDEYKRMSANARQYALDWLNDDSTEQATARVLGRAISGKAPIPKVND